MPSLFAFHFALRRSLATAQSKPFRRPLLAAFVPIQHGSPPLLKNAHLTRFFGSYLPLSKCGLEHPELKQSGEQEEPLFMALIVKENLPLSTHRRPYLRFSEEARGPSGQSQLQPAQMRIDCPLESDYSPSKI